MAERKITKNLSVYFFRVHGILEDETTPPVPESTWNEILGLINELPIDIKQHQSGNPSRFFRKDGVDYGLLFYDEDKKIFILEHLRDSVVLGIIYKRREVNWPFLENGQGNFEQISTNTEDDSLAELTYFLVDKRRSVLLLVSNPRAASKNTFEEYLLSQWKRATEMINTKESKESPTPPYPLRFDHMLHPNINEDFHNMQEISKVEIQVSGGRLLDEMANRLSDNDSMEKILRSDIRLARDYNSRTLSLSFNIDTERDITMRGRLKKGLMSVAKKIMQIEDNSQFVETLKSNARNKCSAVGKIDDATRVLDLLESKLLYKTSIEVSGRYPDFATIFKSLREIYNSQSAAVQSNIESDLAAGGE